MCPVIVVVTHVLGHQASEMPLVEYDHMIEQVSPAITDEAFCDSVLSRTAKLVRFGSIPKLLMVATTAASSHAF